MRASSEKPPLRGLGYVLGAWLFATSCCAAQDSPECAVYKLYKDYAWVALGLSCQDCTVLGKELAHAEVKVLETYFTAELARLMDRSRRKTRPGEVGLLDFDPIYSSQDPGAKDLKIRALPNDRVKVTFVYPGNGSGIELEYVMAKTREGWRVGDILYRRPKMPSLRAILLQARDNPTEALSK